MKTRRAAPLPPWDAYIRFERVVSEEDIRREYALYVGPDLFGGWALLRTWGRTGNSQRSTAQYDPSHEDGCVKLAEHQLSYAGRLLKNRREGADVEGQPVRCPPNARPPQRDQPGVAEEAAEHAIDCAVAQVLPEVAEDHKVGMGVTDRLPFDAKAERREVSGPGRRPLDGGPVLDPDTV